jgi:hypothetical protein
MTEQGPPRIDADKLDFSEFHPLDHWPGSAYCRSLPGGTRNHLDMAWHYKWRGILAAETLCRIGRHEMTTVWRRDRALIDPTGEWTSWRACRHCAHRPKDQSTSGNGSGIESN